MSDHDNSGNERSLRRRSRRSARSDDTRRAIFAAAASLFVSKGYASTSIEDITREAKVAKATVYYHFQNKEDLYASLVVDHCEGAMIYMDEVVAAPHPAVTRVALLLDYLTDSVTNPGLKHLHYDRSVHFDPEIRASIRDYQRRYAASLKRCISEAQADGHVIEGDEQALALIIFEGVGRLSAWFDPRGRVTQQELMALVRRLIMRGLATREGAVHLGGDCAGLDPID